MASCVVLVGQPHLLQKYGDFRLADEALAADWLEEVLLSQFSRLSSLIHQFRARTHINLGQVQSQRTLSHLAHTVISLPRLQAGLHFVVLPHLQTVGQSLGRRWRLLQRLTDVFLRLQLGCKVGGNESEPLEGILSWKTLSFVHEALLVGLRLFVGLDELETAVLLSQQLLQAILQLLSLVEGCLFLHLHDHAQTVLAFELLGVVPAENGHELVLGVGWPYAVCSCCAWWLSLKQRLGILLVKPSSLVLEACVGLSLRLLYLLQLLLQQPLPRFHLVFQVGLLTVKREQSLLLLLLGPHPIIISAGGSREGELFSVCIRLSISIENFGETRAFVVLQRPLGQLSTLHASFLSLLQDQQAQRCPRLLPYLTRFMQISQEAMHCRRIRAVHCHHLAVELD